MQTRSHEDMSIPVRTLAMEFSSVLYIDVAEPKSGASRSGCSKPNSANPG